MRRIAEGYTLLERDVYGQRREEVEKLLIGALDGYEQVDRGSASICELQTHVY